jgi:serine protease Do
MHKQLVWALVGLLALASPAFGRVMETSDAEVLRQATQAVVNISAWKVHAPTSPGDPPRRVKVYASGFIVDPSGVVITNRHVVDGALSMDVIFNNGDRMPARLVAAAAMLDLAVLRIAADHPLPYLKWANSDALQVGDPVLTIGNPLGLGMSVSAGIVSALNRDLQDTPFDSYIQTDAALNHGNSGGPLVNRAGEVVGIDTALYNPDDNGGFIGIGFAIPANTADYVARLLLDPSHPKPGWLGITLQDMTEELGQALGAPRFAGAIASAVEAAGPASGVLRVGDVLETFNGVRAGDSRAFMRAIVMTKVGTPARLMVWRGGKEQELAMTIGEWPNYMPAGDIMSQEAAQAMIARMPDPGIRLAPLTDDARKQYGLDANLTGALVASVERDCEARDLGIVPGNVITAAQGEPVAGPDDVRRAVQDAHQQRRPFLAILVAAKSGVRWLSLSISAPGS